MHINIIKGDYVFYAWKENELERFKKLVSELLKRGYRKVAEDHDYLNKYEFYKNKDGHEVTLTECCL